MAPNIKVALVTGANQGIGFALVRRFCEEHPDWVIYGTTRSVENGEEASRQLKEDGLTVRYVQADITKPSTIIALRDMIVREHGGLDVLVNNAAITYKRGATDPVEVKAETMMKTNVFGTYFVCEQLFPILNDGARVVMMSSRLAMLGLHRCKKLSTERYSSLIKNDPPMSEEEVLQSMRDFLISVRNGTYVEEGWAPNEADFAGTTWDDDAAYSATRLGVTLLTRAYQYKYDISAPDRDIVFNAVNPGWVRTSLSGFTGNLTPAEGADTAYYASTLPTSTVIRGQLLKEREIMPWE